MAGRASTTRSTSLGDTAHSDKVMLFDHFTNFGFGDIQTMTQQAIMTRVSIIGVNWMQ